MAVENDKKTVFTKTSICDRCGKKTVLKSNFEDRLRDEERHSHLSVKNTNYFSFCKGVSVKLECLNDKSLCLDCIRRCFKELSEKEWKRSKVGTLASYTTGRGIKEEKKKESVKVGHRSELLDLE